MNEPSPRALIVELCRAFYAQGWVSGTGGGVSIRDGGRIYIAPSGVQKERIRESDMYVLDESGEVLEQPASPGLSPSACSPLFFNAYRLRGAGAVIHSHSMHALLATLHAREAFECTELEMIKGIAGHGYHDKLRVPIIENTAHERDLAEAMAEAIAANPRTYAVLVRRHGVYIWGKDWVEAKTHAECYHYLFEAAVRMAALGVDARKATEPPLGVLEGGKR
ncbi:MAG TPA: methylthioribulose 1-phosphate dehydratase [Polyangiaceae bacterium]|jgi:methylthioribulose-1-phosphate dehydratase|nr:methylthioribulose 1-phosphate dehydratase [Polyangiaceae bacterium]